MAWWAESIEPLLYQCKSSSTRSLVSHWDGLSILECVNVSVKIMTFSLPSLEGSKMVKSIKRISLG